MLWEPKQVLYHLNGGAASVTGGFYSVPKEVSGGDLSKTWFNFI